MTTIDCSGMLCPRPLIEAKKAYNQAPFGEQLSFIVDNKTAANNLNTYFSGNGVQSTTITEHNKHVITVTKSESTNDTIITSNPAEFCVIETPTAKIGSMVVAISSNKMGEGDAELGTILMKGFFAALSEYETMPSEVIFYNSGVLLLVSDSGIITYLEKMKLMGVRITACGTCTDFYGIKDIAIGTISNMFSILSSLSSASKVIKP